MPAPRPLRVRAARRTLRYEDVCGAPLEALRSIYDLQGRACPGPVLEHARRHFDPDRRRRWADVPTATQRFREGVERARITDLMRDLGYDPL